MDYGYFHYEEPYARPSRRVNYFGWTLVILLLTGTALAAWIFSFYIFGQPERPESYRILQKLHKVDPPKRFELTAAPPGEFLSPKQLYERYSVMGSAQLAKTNAELARNYIRNFQGVRGLVPYVIGRYVVEDARELGPQDIFTSGMVALTNAADNGELLMEHLYPASEQVMPLMKQTLTPGLDIKLERTHDLSAVIHAERLGDGRMMITAIPLLYGTYTVTRGPGTFTLEPPLTLNLEPGWPLYKEQGRLRAEMHYADYRRGVTGPQGEGVPVTGLAPSGTPPPPENALVRVESAKAVEPVAPVLPTPNAKGVAAKATPPGKHGKLAKNQKATPAPSAAPKPPVVAQQQSAPAPPPVAVVTPPPPPAATRAPVAVVAQASPAVPPAPAAQAPPVEPPQPIPANPSGALASTAGGGTWKTFAPGKMPLGRLVATSDLKDLADRGIVGERIYLKGQFVVNFADANRAVLRPRTRLASAMLHLGGGSSTRIIVEFPAGYSPPAQGSVVSRDEARPLEITEVRKQEDGQLNVFAREIMQ
jgi:hypothetical protein